MDDFGQGRRVRLPRRIFDRRVDRGGHDSSDIIFSTHVDNLTVVLTVRVYYPPTAGFFDSASCSAA